MKYVAAVWFVLLVLMIGRGCYEIEKELTRLQACLEAQESR